MKTTKECKKFVKERYDLKFTNFNKFLKEYENLRDFAPDGNVWESGQKISEECHYIMRLSTQFYLTEAFKAMKIDLNDENVKEDLEVGNIGTPGRIAKMYCSSSTNDDSEMLAGRWIKEPRMASFQREIEENQQPVWVETQIRAVCSHHFIGFNNNPNDDESIVVVGYIPENGVKGGLSKISRLVRDYSSRRPWLQEDLCNYVGNKIKDKFQSDSVYVIMKKISHNCCWTRGSNDDDSGTTTIFSSGKFKEDKSLIPEKYRG